MAPAPGFLKGYVRRFAQKSHDHRGTPTVRARLQSLIAFLFYLDFRAPDASSRSCIRKIGLLFPARCAHAIFFFLTFDNLLFVDFFGRTTGLVPA